MGRLPLNYVPNITKENQAAADEFMVVIKDYYLDYADLYSSDIAADTLIKCYESIQRNGIKLSKTNPIQDYKNYYFKALKTSNIAQGKKDTRWNTTQKNFLNAEIDIECEDVEKKILNDSWKDFRITYILRMVEENFSAEETLAYKVKNLQRGMTYKKLSETVKIRNPKARCCAITRWLKENVDEEKINKEFLTYLEND